MRFWNEEKLSTMHFAAHLRDSGFKVRRQTENSVWVQTATGIGFVVTIMDVAKFVLFHAYLPLADGPKAEKITLVDSLNRDFFLGSFCLDPEEHLMVSYPIPYFGGVLVGQFAFACLQFSAMLEHFAVTYAEESAIDNCEQSKPGRARLLN